MKSEHCRKKLQQRLLAAAAAEASAENEGRGEEPPLARGAKSPRESSRDKDTVAKLKRSSLDLETSVVPSRSETEKGMRRGQSSEGLSGMESSGGGDATPVKPRGRGRMSFH
jgi:hypothetical protein